MLSLAYPSPVVCTHSLLSVFVYAGLVPSSHFCVLDPRDLGANKTLAISAVLKNSFWGQGRDSHLDKPFQSHYFEGSAQELVGTQRKSKTEPKERSIREGFLKEVTEVKQPGGEGTLKELLQPPFQWRNPAPAMRASTRSLSQLWPRAHCWELPPLPSSLGYFPTLPQFQDFLRPPLQDTRLRQLHQIPYDPAINSASGYICKGIESRIWKRCLYIHFTAALFTIDETWKQPKCLLMGEWIGQMRYTYIQRNIVQP